MNFDDDVKQEFPALDKIGEYVAKPKYLVYLNQPGSTTFATNEVPKLQNELFHYLIMRETQCTAADAMVTCLKTKPTVIVEQFGSPISYEADYLVLH